MRVSKLCLGTMTFASREPWGASREASKAIFEAYSEAGGNFIDTANMYADGESEKLLGELIASDRERYVLATKYANAVPGRQDANAAGSHRKSLAQSIDASLKRLGVDYIDLYLVHFWDFTVPVEEVMRALDDAVSAGKILHAGLSDVPAWVAARAQAFHELRGLCPVACMQLEYSLVERTIEQEHIPLSRDNNIAITAWSPIAGGILSGKYANPDVDRDENRLQSMQLQPLNERNRKIAEGLGTLAAELGLESAQLALAWILHRGVIPIIGATRVAQLEQNLSAMDIQLDSDTIERLDQISAADLGHPYKMYDWDMSMSLGYGGMFEHIDNPAYPVCKRWESGGSQ